MKDMHLTFLSLFTVSEMDLTILSLKDETVYITNPNDLPKEIEEWKQIAHCRRYGDHKTEFIIKASMKLAPSEVTRKYPKIHVDNQSRRVRLYCSAVDTIHFREVGFFLYMHPRLTNRFQLMTAIEDYIDKKKKKKIYS